MRAPHRAVPAPPDLADPLIATAVAHAGLQDAQRAVDEARMHHQHAAIHREDEAAGRSGSRHDEGGGYGDGREYGAREYDAEDRAWRADVAARRPAA